MKHYHYAGENMDSEQHSHKHHDDNKTIKINCGGERPERETAAFRAVSSEIQRIEEADTFYKVLFQEEEFDFGNIYNANNSTFVPRRSGVYYVAGTVTFVPDAQELAYRVRVEIRVNGVSVAADNDYWGEFSPFVNAVNVNTVLQLEGGDLVEVFVTSTTPGRLTENAPSFSTRFEAAEF
ncbi:hypothetical protein [Sutcliffiella horikoshii]|uniref:hypothetical protein n=1 Tax=Sutcliffiella horikoshii TaxID=79883 RepID=UPI0018E00F44|nr:hypothetical protein [Sutcliffiella horikoshii]